MDDAVGNAQLLLLGKIEKHLATIRWCMIIVTSLVAVTAIQAGVIR